MKIINMQTQDYKTFQFTEQQEGIWELKWIENGETVSELFTEEEQKQIVVSWLNTGFVNF